MKHSLQGLVLTAMVAGVGAFVGHAHGLSTTFT
jgi:hypothetical protein